MSRLSRRGFLAAALAGAATACSAPRAATAPQPAVVPAGFPLGIDNTGRHLVFARPPEAVVSLYPSMTEVLLALGVGHGLVGQAGTGYSEPLPRFRDRFAAIPVLSDSESSTEKLLQARPTLVVADQEYHFDGKRLPSRDELAAKGIQVYINRALYEPTKVRSTVPDSFADITDLGRIFAANDTAKSLVDDFTRQLDDVRRRLTGRAPVPAVLVTSYDKALYAHAGGLYGDVLARAGGENLTAQTEIPPGEYYGQLSAELLTKKDPDVVVYVYREERDRDTIRSDLAKVFAVTSAGRAGRFVPIVEASFAGGLRSAPAVTELAKALHPGM